MIIAQFIESDAPGGTERLAIQIALELKRRGHHVVGVGPADGPGKGWLGRQLQALDCEWTTVPKRPMFDPRAVSDVVSIVRRYRVDVVHSHEFAPSVFGAAASWLTGRTHVATMHSNMYFAGAWRRRAAFKWAVRHSAAVVAVSRDTQQDAERALHLAPGSIHVIPNGIASTPGRREPLRAELGIADDELLVLALGNLSPRKAHILLLRALIALQARRPEIRWRLAIAGTDQGSGPELRSVTAEHGLEGRVHVLGHRSDTHDLLAAADVFAMCSLHEGMPLAIMEAMFAGKPVISSVAGGIAEMITDGVEGLLTPVGDTEALSAGLERLLTSPQLRTSLGAAAITRAERQFGIAPMMDAYLRFYGAGRSGAGA